MGAETHGCDVDAVREIVPYQRPTRLPGAPACVRGLVNLRGAVVTVLDLATWLAADDAARAAARAAADREGGSIVLVECGARVAGVRVDRVRDVRPVPADAIHGAAGFARVDGAIVPLLDLPAIVGEVLT